MYKIDEYSEAAKADLFLSKIVKKEIEAHTSFLSWDEFVWIIRKNLGIEVARKKGKDFLVFPNLIFEPVSQEIINKAQKYMEMYSLKPRDSIHLASAIQKQISEMVTFDDDFKGVKEIKYYAPP